MNELIISVARERLLPVRPGLVEIPNEPFENMMYRIACFITQDIVDSYILFTPWDCPEDTKLELALRKNFPPEWLSIALQSPNVHIKLNNIISSYKLKLSESSIKKIQSVVEFLCYEIIETTILKSNFLPVSVIPCRWIRRGIESDQVLYSIIKQHKLILPEPRNANSLTLSLDGIELSNKAMKLMKIFIEEFVLKIIRSIRSDHITGDDVLKYFNEVETSL